MKNLFVLIVFISVLVSCSTKSQLIYLNNEDTFFDKVNYSLLENKIESGDILKIDVNTIIPEAAIPYNKSTSAQMSSQDLNLLQLDGYLVNKLKMINYPILGEINVDGLSTNQLEKKITDLLFDGGHLINSIVKVRRLNSKFTVLGEVGNPGTFPYVDENLNIFQVIGYAGDLTINGRRKGITLIREENGLRKVYKIQLTNTNLLKKPYYNIKNNDIIIVEPNFSKVKSAGFIGSPSSIASISSIILSITLLIINK